MLSLGLQRCGLLHNAAARHDRDKCDLSHHPERQLLLVQRRKSARLGAGRALPGLVARANGRTQHKKKTAQKAASFVLIRLDQPWRALKRRCVLLIT